MLECLEFRDEKTSDEHFFYIPGAGGGFAPPPLSYGKFAFSRLEKGQGLTVANTLRRVLLYELPAVGITSVLIKTAKTNSENTEANKSLFPNSLQTNENLKETYLDQKDEKSKSISVERSQRATFRESAPVLRGSNEETDKNYVSSSIENIDGSFLSETASSHHEFSTLPGVKESVLEILFNLKSVVFENIFSYSSMQKGTLSLKVLESPEKTSEYTIKASQMVLPSEIHIIHPNQVLATLMSPETPFELEFTIEKITQSDLTNTSSFSGRAPNRSTRNRRILPIDGTVFPVKKVNYTIEQDSFGKEIVFLEVWTNGGLHPRDAVFQSIEKVLKLFQVFKE